MRIGHDWAQELVFKHMQHMQPGAERASKGSRVVESRVRR